MEIEKTETRKSKQVAEMEVDDSEAEKLDSPTNSQQTISDDDEIDYSIKPEFYDPDLDDKDEVWVRKKTKGRISDAVLSCPGCFTTLCLECQRHEKYVTQYRAIFVVNCKIEMDKIRQEIVKPKKGKRRRECSEEDEAIATNGTGGETFKSVCCSLCSTEVGVIDEDEVYHFFNVLPRREKRKKSRSAETKAEKKKKMASSRGGGVVRAGELEKMSLEQLKAVKEQADIEVNLLQDSLNNIRTATGRLEIASTALHDLSLRPPGKKMLVPLTASLYVPGTLDDAEKVLVDIGTGFFAEKTMVEGKDYCERKINLLKSNFDQLIEVASKKKTLADEAGVILQAKLKQVSPSN